MSGPTPLIIQASVGYAYFAVNINCRRLGNDVSLSHAVFKLKRVSDSMFVFLSRCVLV